MQHQKSHSFQADWEKVGPIAATAANLFYGKLFELDPSLKTLFKSDMEEQKAKLMQIIGVAVRSLGDLPALVPTVQALGKRHTGYGVQKAHYDTVGAALLWTLKQGLGDAFDDVHEASWGKVYGLLSRTMIEAA